MASGVERKVRLKTNKTVRKYFTEALTMVRRLMGAGQTGTDELNRNGALLFGSKFKGVLAKDEFTGTKPGFYIVNLDTHTKKGSHWVAIVRLPRTNFAIVYDTFGRRVFGKGKQWQYVDPIVPERANQADCGQRCIAFLVMAEDFGLRLTEQIAK